MNGVHPTIGIEFDDKYIDAKNKFADFINALNKLTPLQREQLAKEYLEATGMTALFMQFANYMNNGGRP